MLGYSENRIVKSNGGGGFGEKITWNEINIHGQIWADSNLKYDDGGGDIYIGEHSHEVGLYYTWRVSAGRMVDAIPGWRIPTISDFETLRINLGGTFSAGGKLKNAEIGNFWIAPNSGATNETGFNARGAGFINIFQNTPVYFGVYEKYLTIESTQAVGASTAQLFYNSKYLRTKQNVPAWHGCSIRMIKDL